MWSGSSADSILLDTQIPFIAPFSFDSQFAKRLTFMGTNRREKQGRKGKGKLNIHGSD